MHVKVHGPSRPVSPLPPEAFDTYQVGMPKTSLRVITCQEADCEQYHNGWYVECDESFEGIGRRRAEWFRSPDCRHRWFECHRLNNGELAAGRHPALPTVFYFEAGQQCFNEHTTTAGPLLFLVRQGDWRAQGRDPNRVRIHKRAVDWVEDCSEAVDKFNRNRNKG